MAGQAGAGAVLLPQPGAGPVSRELSATHLHWDFPLVHTIPSVSSQNSFPAPSGFLGYHATSVGNKIIIIMITLQQKGYPQNYILWKKQGS